MANGKNIVKVIISEKKENGHYRFREKIMPADEAKKEIKAARN